MKQIILILVVILAIGCKNSSRFGSSDGDKVQVEKGDKGEQGVQGVTGDTGAKGDKGDNGKDGETGATGPRGYAGLTGAKGDKGDTGLRGDVGPRGLRGLTGPAGKNGEAGKSAIAPQVYLTPTYGKCVKLMSGVYMKNEGEKADFYKNSTCSHGSNDSNVYCNNVTDGELGSDDREVCTIIFSNQTMYRYTIVGSNEDMCVVEEKFTDLPVYKTI